MSTGKLFIGPWSHVLRLLMLTRLPAGLIGIVSRAKVQKRFEAYGTGIRLEWSWKVPPGTYGLRISRIPGSLQRRFESRALRAVTLGALGREQSDEKRENIYPTNGRPQRDLFLEFPPPPSEEGAEFSKI